MTEIRKLLKLDKLGYYKTHLSLLNCLLPIQMTPREIEIIAAFMSLEGDIAQYRFGPSAKKIIMQQLEMSPANLSNYIGSLTEKGFLVKHGDLTHIHDVLIPGEKEQTYTLKLTIKDANIDAG